MFVEFQPFEKSHDEAPSFREAEKILIAANRVVGFEYSDPIACGSDFVSACRMLVYEGRRWIVAGTAIDNSERVANALFTWERNIRVSAAAWDRDAARDDELAPEGKL